VLVRVQVVYVYRNSKDVTVSLFHFLRSINVELTYSGPWNQFVRSFLLGEGSHLSAGPLCIVAIVIVCSLSVYYAPWSQHINDYHSMGSAICFVAYEDLLTVSERRRRRRRRMSNVGPSLCVRRIAAYLGRDKELTDEKLDQLEKWCSFASMKNNPKVNYSWFNEYGFVKKSFKFFRKGRSTRPTPSRLAHVSSSFRSDRRLAQSLRCRTVEGVRRHGGETRLAVGSAVQLRHFECRPRVSLSML
jgi:hypothetical protein